MARIAIIKDYVMFKIYLVAAFLNAKMPEDVKHRWSMLGEVSAILIRKRPLNWQQFINPKGRVLVEAAFYWLGALMTMWIEAGYVVTDGDKCVVLLVEGDNAAHVAMTVDNGSSEAVKDSIIKLLSKRVITSILLA
jgi:hypothetical protein